MYNQLHMESSYSDSNDEEYFQYIVEVVINQKCACIWWKDNNYINQTNHDGFCA